MDHYQSLIEQSEKLIRDSRRMLEALRRHDVQIALTRSGAAPDHRSHRRTLQAMTMAAAAPCGRNAGAHAVAP